MGNKEPNQGVEAKKMKHICIRMHSMKVDMITDP